MKKLHLLKRTLLLLALIVGCVNYGWADSYTITFKTNSGDGTKASTTTSCSLVVTAGSASYVTGNLATATNTYYGGSAGLKLGTASNAGTIKMNLSSSITPTSVVVSAKRYNTDKSATLKVNGSATQTISTSSSFNNYTYDITSNITYLELVSSKYIWIQSVTVNYTSGPQDVTLSFEQPTPSITLTKGDGFYDGTFTQTVSKSPAAYSGTITYSIDFENSTNFTSDDTEINSSTGEIIILSEINKSGSIKVVASGTEVDGKYNEPADATYTLTVNAYKPATPTFSTEGGAVDYGTELTLTSGVTIKYTTDGETTPTASEGSTYSVPIVIKDAMTVKAVAVDGSAVSDVASFDFTINTPAAVTFSTPGSTDSKNPEAVPYGTKVTLTHGMAPSLGSIVYTTNNRNPGKVSEAVAGQQTYSEPITITKNTTLKARFLSDNDLYLGDYEAQYYSIANPDAPTFSVPAGYVAKDTEVELSKSTTDGVIKYTTDGTEPSAENGTEYSDAIVISTGMTIKAIVIISDANGTYTSDVASAQYKVTGEPEILPYEESFATDFGAFTSDGAEISDTGVKIWTWDDDDDCAFATTYYNETEYDGTSWMYSPVIDLTSVKGAELTFQQYQEYFTDATTEATLWAKEVGGDWSKLTMSYPSTTSFEEQTIDISTYAGKKMQFAFKYVGNTSGSGFWEIKNLSVTQIKGNANLAISGTPSATMDVTTTQTLTTTSDSDGAITFSSSDASIATVNATTGEVTAVSPGYVTITVSQAEASEYKADEVEFNITVTVKPAVNSAGSEVTGNYEKVTDASSLAEGDKVIVVNETAKKALSTEQRDSNRGSVSVTITSGSPNTIESIPGLQEITLEDAGENMWYLNVGDDAYLYANGTSSNYLKTTTKTSAGNYGKATISFSSNNAVITFQGGNARNLMRFNKDNSPQVFSCYGSGQQTIQLYRFVPGDDSFDVTIGSTGWKTIVSKYDVSVPNTHKAYIVTSTGERASIEAVTKIKANTPVILKGTAGSTCTLTILNEVVSYPSENLLAISDNTTGNGVYVLADKGNGVGFYKWIGGSLGAGRVYLPAPDAEGREFIGFDFDDETTGIKAFGNGESTIDGYYDLSGRKVAQPAKGLYIVNGRKVVIK